MFHVCGLDVELVHGVNCCLPNREFADFCDVDNLGNSFRHFPAPLVGAIQVQSRHTTDLPK